MSSIARIVLPDEQDGCIQKTLGTQVFVDGHKLSGIFKIELTGNVDDIWRAKIHTFLDPPREIRADAVVYVHPDAWWKKLWRRITNQVRQVTHFESHAHKYMR